MTLKNDSKPELDDYFQFLLKEIKRKDPNPTITTEAEYYKALVGGLRLFLMSSFKKHLTKNITNK